MKSILGSTQISLKCRGWRVALVTLASFSVVLFTVYGDQRATVSFHGSVIRFAGVEQAGDFLGAPACSRAPRRVEHDAYRPGIGKSDIVVMLAHAGSADERSLGCDPGPR